MKIQNTILASSLLALGLAGCGTEQQDGTVDGRSAQLTSGPEGIVIDGPVARALVYFDLNQNLKKESFEPSALTDNDGYFNKNPNTGVDYCVGESANATFCLQAPSSVSDNTQIIVTGGYDLYTGEPFEGSMSMPANSYIAQSALGEESSLPITPTTSLLANADGDSLATYFPDILEHGNVNYLESEDTFTGNEYNFQFTYTMHKLVSVISAWVGEQYPEIGENENLPTDVSPLIYKQFQYFLLAGDHNIAISNIHDDISALYAKANLPLPSYPSGNISANLVTVITAINAAFGTSGELLTFQNVKARMRGVEVVVLKIIRGADATAAVAALSDPAYIANLAGDNSNNGNINFTQIVEFTGDEAGLKNAADNAAQNQGNIDLGSLAGKSLEFEDKDPSVNSKAAIFFTGEAGATEGDIHLCLQYDGDSDVDLDGNYISGSWSTLPALNNTVILNMNIFGGMTAVLKKVGVEGNQTQYRFDYANEITKFSSDRDLEDTVVDIPTSNEACEPFLAMPLPM